MEMLIAVLALLLGAVSGWIVRDRTLAQLLRKSEIDRAMAEATAKQVPTLETELATLRSSEQQLIREKAAFETSCARVPELETEVNAARAKVEQLTAETSRLETELRNQQRAVEEKEATLTNLRSQIEQEIKNLANEALQGNQQSFLNLANEVFNTHRDTSATELDERKRAIDALLAPLATALKEYQECLSEIEKVREKAYGRISTELQNVVRLQVETRTETSKLVNALRAAPKTRGRWGEHQLRNVLELAQLMPYIDFLAEETYWRGDEKLRPDVVIRLPGDRHIVVDAKTPIVAYLDAVEAVDEETREARLNEHARQMRQHMKQLAAKSYWDALAVTPDFVVMFVPGENFFAAAVERDRDLFEDAIKQRVLITTPTTLIVLAKAVALGWRQEKVAENTRQIANLGREIYKRLRTMGQHVADVGTHLGETVNAYNSFVGSLESSVMPQGRKFNELEVEGTQERLKEFTPIDAVVRSVRPDRDLILVDSNEVGASEQHRVNRSSEELGTNS
jgi:DNA recombination protein RmuC